MRAKKPDLPVQVVIHLASGLPLMLLTDYESGEPQPVDPRFVLGAGRGDPSAPTTVELDGDMSVITVREHPQDVWRTALHFSTVRLAGAQ